MTCTCFDLVEATAGIPPAYFAALGLMAPCAEHDPVSDYRNLILQGDVREQLRRLPDRCVHTVITSPPYWGLRDYKVEGQLGLEPTPEEFVANMVDVFREVRRVLRNDGTLWLNLGDSYAGSGRGTNSDGSQGKNGEKQQTNAGANLDMHDRLVAEGATGRFWKAPPSGLKRKDLVGIPWRVAFALQADGWYLRRDIIWSKPNPMPESARDRPTTSHEYIFLMSKSRHYFYDDEAVKEPSVSGPSDGLTREQTDPLLSGSALTNIGRKRAVGHAGSRARRSVWSIPIAGYAEAHFATYPPDLVKVCIQAGTSEHGCCGDCGAPFERVFETDDPEGRLGVGYHDHTDDLGIGQRGVPAADGAPVRRTIDWRPTCKHHQPGAGIRPAVVLDPFMGSGTTALVAMTAARDYVGTELSAAYVAMSERRLAAMKRQQRLL